MVRVNVPAPAPMGTPSRGNLGNAPRGLDIKIIYVSSPVCCTNRRTGELNLKIKLTEVNSLRRPKLWRKCEDENESCFL